MAIKYQFLKKRENVFPYVKHIQNASDNERNALGFLVPRAYEEAIYSEKVILALTCDEIPEYAGHIMFGGVYPNACLLYTSPSPRDQRGSRMPSSA